MVTKTANASVMSWNTDRSFKIDACGKKLRYERMGTGYFDTAKGDPLDQAMGKASAAPTETAAPETISAPASSTTP